ARPFDRRPGGLRLHGGGDLGLPQGCLAVLRLRVRLANGVGAEQGAFGDRDHLLRLGGGEGEDGGVDAAQAPGGRTGGAAQALQRWVFLRLECADAGEDDEFRRDRRGGGNAVNVVGFAGRGEDAERVVERLEDGLIEPVGRHHVGNVAFGNGND